MDRIVMAIMAAGVVIGSVDWILGNRWGYGKKMEEGFLLLGPTAVSMAGIICLAPVLSDTLGRAAAPLYRLLRVDPGMFGGFLAIDMGGFQLAAGMGEDPVIAAYAGIVVASIFGCTLVFTIPLGMRLIEERDRGVFARGIMAGIAAMPAALLAGGLLAGLTPAQALWQNLPVFAVSLLMAAGLKAAPERMVRGFSAFASGIRALTVAGLGLGAAAYLLKVPPFLGMAPIEDAMATVSSIGIAMLGSLPMAELLRRALDRPLERLGKRLGMNPASVAGLLMLMVSPVPVFTMLKDMDERGKLANVACMVSAASVLAAHLGFAVSAAPELVGAMLAAKLIGGAAGILVCLVSAGQRKKPGRSAAPRRCAG